MIKLKDYYWALEGLAALVLLIAFIMMAIYNTEVALLAIKLTGLGILFFTIIRIKPIISSRNEKDYVLLMFSEILIDLAAGIMMLFFTDYVVSDKNNILTFSRLSGAVLFVRGVCHFWTTSKRYELHDIISFIMHITFLSFGFLFFVNNKLNQKDIVLALMILAVILVIFFSYRTYKGYNNYRIQKTNLLKIGDYINKKDEKTNEVVLDDPKTIEERINPKKIEEPTPPVPEKVIDEPNDEKRPFVDIN